jgi:hypothetical protein
MVYSTQAEKFGKLLKDANFPAAFFLAFSSTDRFSTRSRISF